MRLHRLVLMTALLLGAAQALAHPRVLVFTRTEGFRHDSIPAAVEALRRLAAEEGLGFAHSEDPAVFDDAALADVAVVVFANTTGEAVPPPHQGALERFVRRGGGYLGIHAAADTGYDWPWYGGLVGAWFLSHPPGLQTARVHAEPADPDAPAWRVTDEFYDFRENPRPRVRVIARLDTADHREGRMGADHPIAWCHDYDGGRAWYTGLGHTEALYRDPRFLEHLRAGLRWSAGLQPDCR
ncbi:ThuA domain-containing protein [Coralloluteibacterium thermophilus]|uniref:ThuA domain-containing protein n=1 Tax=Coralloluteibacterium thermophilum TaxID=2707049 RepID=A0ABV9NNF1_9GAMM